eukprot:301336_1
MNIRAELTSLSPWVYCWFATLAIIWFLSFIWMWQFSLCCSLFIVPFMFFIRWWYKNRMHCSLNHVLKPFLHGYINITLLSILGQFVGLLIITAIFAATQIIYHTVGYLFYLVIAITYYVFIEEILKLYFSLKSRDSVIDSINQISKAHTISSTATALGYSMCTGILWTAFAAFILNNDDKKYHDKYSLFGWLFLITLIIAVIGMPMQLITGYVMGCKITAKDLEYQQQQDNDNQPDELNSHDRLPFKSYVRVIYYSVFIRSSYLFFLFNGFLVLQFNIVGVLIALLGIILDYFLLIRHTKKIESKLPFDYLQRAGQLSIFGYNLLSDAPELYEEDVHVTAVSLNNFSTNVDEPMVISSNNQNSINYDKDDDEEMQYKNDDLDDQNEKLSEEIAVPLNILSSSNDELSASEKGVTR